MKILILLLLLLLLSIPSYASNECNKPKANLLHKSECDFNSGQLSRSRASLEKFKSTTGPEVHDFIDYKIIKFFNPSSKLFFFRQDILNNLCCPEISVLTSHSKIIIFGRYE